MKILVTGAAGFIGGQLWHTLWKRGDEVVGIDKLLLRQSGQPEV